MVHKGGFAYLLWQPEDKQFAKPGGLGVASLCNVTNHMQQCAGSVVMTAVQFLGGGRGTVSKISVGHLPDGWNF